jgi:hypothetical protein
VVGCQGEHYWIGSLVEAMVEQGQRLFSMENLPKAEKEAARQLDARIGQLPFGGLVG